jgi:hypothetical protein
MTKFFLASSFAMIVLISSQAFAADASKAQTTAEFRVKVATCKATSGKANTSDFYRAMASCIDKVTVTTTVASAK